MVDGYYRREISDNPNANHPSFSSTLLDAIYRSIDQGEDQNLVMYGERKKQQQLPTEEEIANFQRTCMIEKWMEKKVREKAAARRKSTEAVFRSSSWDSSGGGGGGAGFLSSSFYEKRPKPIRVCDSGLNKEKSASKSQDGFMKTKSRALKIYADLKKVKQPISPGARLAGFLNSLFTAAGNTKKPKMNNPKTNPPILKSANASSTCSSASSFSRSCLSKTPSSRGKSAGSEKRCVRFNEDFPPCGNKPYIHEEMNVVNYKKQDLEAINEEIMVHANVIEKNRRDFLRNYHLTKSHDLDQEFEDDDDDAASYASSDLFELDNLSAIGMDRYREELPVYETTRLHTNRAIASGLIL